MISHDATYLSHAPSELQELVEDLRAQLEKKGESLPDPIWTVGRTGVPEEEGGGQRPHRK